VNKTTLRTVRKHTVIRLREEVLSVADLNEVLSITQGNETNGRKDVSIVIVDYGGKKIGIGVDRLRGNEEIVIKSLSRHYREIDGLIGASIMGNGKIALIIDVETMVNRYYDECLQEELSEHDRTGRRVARGRKYHGKKPQDENPEDRNPKDSILGRESPPQTELSDEVKGTVDNTEQAVELGQEHSYTLDEIHTAGAITATISMSELMKRDIRVSFPETKVVELSKVAEELGGEEAPVGGIYVGLKGDIAGGILIVLPIEHVYGFSDLLLRREPGTTVEIGESEVSGLTEMGNILSASFIRSASDKTKLSVLQDVPELKIDMCLPVIDSILARFNQPGTHIILTKAELYYDDTEQAICHLLLFMEPDSMKKLVDSLKNAMPEEVEG
jgi:chemotaxis protein CheC